MSPRVTRASTARLNADPDAQASSFSPTHPSPPSSTPRAASASRKRKAAPDHASNLAQHDTRRSKRPRAARSDPEAPDLTPEVRRKTNRSTTAAMSSTESVKPVHVHVPSTDKDSPSSSTSAETSPHHVPHDSSKRRSGRRRSKEGVSSEKNKKTPKPVTNISAEPSGSGSASGSRKTKKNAKKDQDVHMEDADEKPEPPSSELPQSEKTPRQDTGTGAGARAGAGAGAGSDDETKMRDAEEDPDSMDRSDDPFASGVFGRLAGNASLSSSLRALSGIMAGTNGRLRNILEQLRTKEDPSVQLIAVTDLSELLLVSNEDNLAGHFAPDQYVKELVALMQPNEFTGEENPEIMLLACRCIANMMEALPASTASVVYGGAVPILCQKLLEIHFIDLAEQALSTLEKISVEFPSSIVREGGLTACLTYLDFFATSTQRTAVTTAANCCRNIPEDSFATVRDVMPILLNTLSSSDQRVVEQASLCVSRVVDSFKFQESKLEELVGPELLKAILRLILPGSTNMIGPSIHAQFLRVLSITARASPRLSAELLKLNVVDSLYQILTGVSPPADTEDAAVKIDKNIIMQAIIRTPREQIFETLNVICELLPSVSKDGLIFLEDLYDAGYTGIESTTMADRSKQAQNDKRVEFMKDCPAQVKRFVIILFPTLMHAYTSTVNLSVRQKVLTAQLKMLSNVDTNILEDSLRGVAYASHLASILAQQDNLSLVTFALQAAELLLKRLESIYRSQFYREGVMAEITKLAERPLKANISGKETNKSGDTAEVTEVDVELESENMAQQDEDSAEGEPDTVEVEIHQPELHVAGEGNDENEEEDVEEPENDDGEDDEDDSEENSETSAPISTQHSRKIMDMQDIVTLRAQRFLESHGHDGAEDLRSRAGRVLDDLRVLGGELKECYSGVNSRVGADLFRRLAKYFDGDAIESITSYELMSSGVVDVLLQIFNNSDQEVANQARSDFIGVFMATRTRSTLATGDAKSPLTAFSVLVHKLQDLLSRAEHFEVVTVHHNAFESNRSSATSMLAKQIRLKLVADDDSGIPRPYRNIMVSIHAIATFKALDDYLRPRISSSEHPRALNRDGISSAMAAYAAAMAGRGDRSSAFLPTDFSSSLPTRSLSEKPSKTKSSKIESAPQADSEQPEETRRRLRRSSRRKSAQASTEPLPGIEEPGSAAKPSDETDELQDALECADEAHQMSDDDEDMEADLDAIIGDLEEGAALDREAPDPSAINVEVANTGKVTARTDDGARVNTPSGNTPVATPTTRDRLSATARLLAAREMLSTPTSSSRAMSYASALQQTPQDWHIEFSANDQAISSETTIYRACHFNSTQGDEFTGRSIWSSTHTIKFKKVQGPPPTEKSATYPVPASTFEEGVLPPSLGRHPVTSDILRLMSILHNINENLEEVLADDGTAVNPNIEPVSQFINTKLTAKMNRQLEEPLIVASQCLPGWSEDLTRLYPFLFPFETRHLFLQSTSFGYSRSMARWQGSTTESESRRQRDDRPFLGRVQRQKVRISRSRILESAIKVMELYGQSSSILEVEYFEEVGTGLGPTLEFYSTVSKEFSRKKTKMWRENESSDGGDYAFGRRGLFPAPMSESMSQDENGKRILHLFRMLGKFVARSMLDSRIIDVSFNPVFFRVGEKRPNVVPSLAAVAAVDLDLANSMKMLNEFVVAKQRVDEDCRLSPTEKMAKLQGIRINDASIDDLGLDFTLPGYPHIELQPYGMSTDVTIDNVADYIKKVKDFTLGSGVQRQAEAFRSGFSQVFPHSALRAFTADELVMLFGRVDEDWSLETLMDSIKADHGYNLDSRSVRNLLQVMSELPPQAKRDFLQFVTGSPKLPIGGFKALTPMFTVVCRPSEAPFTPDDYLPSVMTCVNYLKMPDYSSLDVLKSKLGVAIKEGQGAFHLS